MDTDNNSLQQRYFLYYLLLFVFTVTPFLFGFVLFQVNINFRPEAEEIEFFFILPALVMAGASLMITKTFFLSEGISKKVELLSKNLEAVSEDRYKNFTTILYKLLTSLIPYLIICLALNDSISLIGLMYSLQGGGFNSYLPYAFVDLILNCFLLTSVLCLKKRALEAYNAL